MSSLVGFEVRTYDGRDNNREHPAWGTAGSALLRLTTPSYYGGVAGMGGRGRPAPREISNRVCAGGGDRPHPFLTDAMWAWGQFLDHEIDLTPTGSEVANIRTPADDPQLPNAVIEFHRSLGHPGTGTDVHHPREQVNLLSAPIDGANVYGANATRAAALRRFDGTGKLRTDPSPHGDLLPRNAPGLPNATLPPHQDPLQFFLAGDVRANEHVVLLAMHTVWAREHNRQCELLFRPRDELRGADLVIGDIARRLLRVPSVRQALELPPGTHDLEAVRGRDEFVYQLARRIVGAKMQVITYEEFLVELLGASALPRYAGYDPNVNPGIGNLFATAAYRLGHSMVSAQVMLAKPDGPEPLPLQLGFFRPELIRELGIEPLLGGLHLQRMQRVDVRTVEPLRSWLFNVFDPRSQEPRPAMLDLASLNIQRGRDHGLPDYNTARADFGLGRRRTFADLSTDEETVARLAAVYGDVDTIDPWLGGLAEDVPEGAVVGELIHVVLRDQFLRLRDGDRFYYEADPLFTEEDRAHLRRTTLSNVITSNTGLRDLPHNLFRTRPL